MISIYQYIKDNPQKIYLYSRIGSSFLVFLLLGSLFSARDSVSYKVMLIALAISIFAGLFWGFFFANRELEPNIAKVLVYIDLSIIFVFVFPVVYHNTFYLLLPAVFLITVILLFEHKDRNIIVISFFSLFALTSFIYTISGVFDNPGQIFVSHLLLFALITANALIALNTIKELETKGLQLETEKKQLETSLNGLKRELDITRQNADILNKDVRKRDIEIKNILNMSGQLTVREDARKVLTTFLFTAIGQIGSVHAAILTKQKKEHHFINVYIQKGLRGVDINKIRIYMDSNLIQLLNATREPFLVSQIPHEGLFEDEIKLLKIFRNDLLCPIIVKGHLNGVLIIGGKVSGQAFSREDLNMASIIANQTSFVLEQTQVAQEYRDFYSKTLRAMLQSLEAKYTFARGHNLRTANFVNIVARKIGLHPREIKELSYGTLLHDIGKIAVQDKYLLNQTKFSANDSNLKEKILEHTIEGSKILKSAGFSQTIIDMALHHHESYEGGGYPHQLRRNELSIGTRILTVCNSFDAMTSDRPYRKALPVTAAKENLVVQAGKLFDPMVVKAFLDEVENNQAMLKYH